MKIKAEKWILDEDDEVTYHIVDMKKCCDNITNSKSIVINSEDSENSRYYFNFSYSVKLHRSAYIDEYIGEEHLYETIKFCPFCGEKMDIEIVKTVDKINEVNQLHNEVKILRKKCNETDSKKEEKMLRDKIEELNKQIDYMMTDDDFQDYINK